MFLFLFCYYSPCDAQNAVEIDGKLGIGVAAPDAMIEIDGDAAQPIMHGKVNGNTQFYVSKDGGLGLGGALDPPQQGLSLRGNSIFGTGTSDSRVNINSFGTIDPLRVRVDGNTKLFTHSNGGTAFGANVTPPANGMYVTGDLGLGVASPGARLHIEHAAGADDPQLLLEETSTSSAIIEFRNTEPGSVWSLGGRPDALAARAEFELKYGGTGEILTALGDGRIGINNSNPMLPLQVDGGSDASLTGGGYFMTNSENSSNIVMDNNEIMARNNGAAAKLFLQNEGGGLALHGNLPEVNEFVILADGKTGIGENNPNAKMHVYAENEDAFRVQVDGTTRLKVFQNGSVTVGSNTQGPAGGLYVADKLGIGTSNPAEKLEVQNGEIVLRNSAGDRKARIYSGNDGGIMRFYGNNDNLNIQLTHGASSLGNAGLLYLYDENGSHQVGMYVDGTEGNVFADVKSFRMDYPGRPGKEIWYACLEGPEAAAYERGTATLVDGRAEIRFSTHFELVANPETMTVILTPGDADSKGLAVIEKHADRIVVQELFTGQGNYSFDWEVKCVRKGYEDFQIVRDVLPPAPE